MLTFQSSLHLLQQPIASGTRYSQHCSVVVAFPAYALPFQSYVLPRIGPLFVNKPQKMRKPRVVSVEGEVEEDEDFEEEEREGFSAKSKSGYRGKEDEKKYDRDPEFADILGKCLDEPEKARTKMEERLRRKRNKIIHTKTGSATPMKVTFNKFDFTNSYIWFEFHNAPLDKDVSLICDTIRSWHIIGRLGGCNSMNMQLSQAPMDKRPSYDVVQGANVTPTTFYNIGDLEVQDNLARICIAEFGF